MKQAFILLLTVSLLLSGCTAINTEEQLMAVVMGIDLTDEKHFRVTVKVPSFSAPQEGGNDSYMTLSAEAEVFPAALNRLFDTAPRSLNFSQTRLLLIESDALLRDPGLFSTLHTLDGMRSQAMISICREEAGSLLEKQKVAVGTRLSRYIDSTLDHALKEGVIPDSTLIRTLSQTGGGYQDALLSVLLSAQTQQTSDSSVPASQQEQQESQSPAKKNQSNVLWTGAAVMDGHRLSGYLSPQETMLCRFISGEISTINYRTGDGIYQLTSRFGPRISVEQHPDSITVSVRGNINLLPRFNAPVDLHAIAAQLEEDTVKLLHTLQSLRCDALGIGGLLSRQFMTLSDWENSNWKENYLQAEKSVRFTLTLMDE